MIRVKKFAHCQKGAYSTNLAGIQVALLLVLVISGFLVVVSSGCSKSESKHAGYEGKDAAVVSRYSTNPAVNETVSAGNYMRELKMQNRLPGITLGDRGEITSAEIDVSGSEKYPISRTFFAVKKGDQTKSKYHYTFTRRDATSEWQLAKAWRTDSKGSVVEELETK